MERGYWGQAPWPVLGEEGVWARGSQPLCLPQDRDLMFYQLGHLVVIKLEHGNIRQVSFGGEFSQSFGVFADRSTAVETSALKSPSSRRNEQRHVGVTTRRIGGKRHMGVTTRRIGGKPFAVPLLSSETVFPFLPQTGSCMPVGKAFHFCQIKTKTQKES